MDINLLHEKLFEMLCVVDSICRKEGINYYIDSGTLIGAAREHDFVEWDDDADIVMTRSDYYKFREVVKDYFPNNYRLVDPYDYEGYFYDFIPRIVDMNTILREETDEDRAYENLNNMASVDIFLMDNASDSSFLRFVQKCKARIIYLLALSKRYRINYGKYSFSEKVIVGLFSLIGKAFPLKTLIDWYIKNQSRYSQKTTNYYIYWSIITCLLIYPKSFYSAKTNIEFHGHEFIAPLDYDTVLRSYYGDYMIPVRNGFIVHNSN